MKYVENVLQRCELTVRGSNLEEVASIVAFKIPSSILIISVLLET